jgi:uncharacterized cupredoxin-like copper-binding protein
VQGYLMFARAIQIMAMGFLLIATSSSTLATQTVIHVGLNDSSGNPAMSGMGMKADKATVPPGPVTFEVKNLSKTLVHEMLVVAVAKPDSELPYDAKADRVIEEKINGLGEASDLPPGKAKKLTLTLKAGNYLLICNQPGHFHNGMRVNLLVAK